MFHRTLLDPQLSPHVSTTFLTLAPGSSTSPSLLYPSMSPSTATLRGGLCFGRMAEQSPLTGYWPKSLIEVSSEHTPIVLPSTRGSLDTNVDDLATTLDASEFHDTTDVGRLTSSLFSQEREVSAAPFGVSCSQTHSSMEKSRWDVEPFSSFGKPLSKGKRNRDLESVQDSLRERERFLSEQRDIHDFPEKKADRAFQGECAAQTRLSEVQFELDRREWRMHNADIALYEIDMQLQSELYQSNQLTDQTRREKDLAMWRIRNEKQSCPGRSCSRLPRNWRMTKNLLYRSWKSWTLEEWWTFHAEGRK